MLISKKGPQKEKKNRHRFLEIPQSLREFLSSGKDAFGGEQ